MYKRFIIIFIIIFSIICGGCSKDDEIIKSTSKTNEVIEPVVEDKYVDLNNTPISFYTINGNSLNKLTKINKTLTPMEDIGIFQIYPSNDDVVSIDNGFSNSFYEEWMNYNKDNNIKIGFNIKFKIDNEDISYNIFNPSNTFDKWEYLLNYLYDDYANRNKSFYSHIENDEYNDSTLFTSFKMQSSGECNKIKEKILLTVFTYDSEDDFLDDEYRGNSSSTLTICIDGDC